MTHPLEQRVIHLRRRLRRLVVVHALARVLAASLGAALVLGAIDYLVRFEDTGLRIILSLGLLTAVGWTSHRYLYRGWRWPLRQVELARRLERRFPDLAGDLASSLEFLQESEDDPTAGSVALRRAVVARTSAAAEGIDFARAINRRPVVRAVMTAVAVLLLTGILVAVDPLASQVAVARLAYPWGKMDWPREHYLRLRTRVDRVARGAAFEIEVVDAFGTELPSDGRIHYRVEKPGGGITEETERMRLLGDAMVARRENVTRPFSYRVEGGDDRTMSWIRVEVVQPPTVATLQATLTPPPYTALPTTTSEGDLRGLVGTEVRFQATVTRPLSAVRCRLATGAVIGGAPGADGMSFVLPPPGAAPLRIERSETYWFELVDREGLLAGGDRRYAIQAVADQPPTATLERPSGTRFVTPQAVVPLRAVAKDDLAVARVDLEVSRGGEPSGEAALPRIALFEGPAKADPQAAGSAGRLCQVDSPFNLQSLPEPSPAPGMQLSYRVVARDYLGQAGASDWRRLVVITPEELVDRIAQGQRLALAELARVLELERTSRQGLGRLQARLEPLGHLERLDVDRLRGAELNQREVASALGATADGVPSRIESLLEELASNRVDNPDVQRRMRGLLDELEGLNRGGLPEIAQTLTAAVKSAQVWLDEHAAKGASAPRDEATRASIASAASAQDRVIIVLERLLGELTEWDNSRRFHREIAQVLRAEEDLTRATDQLGRQTLGQDLRALAPQLQAELRAASHDQIELARRLERLLQEMDLTGRTLAERDPLAAQTVQDALARAGQLGTTATMRQAGENVEGNRIAQATLLQKKTTEDLAELLDILSNRPEHELARLTKKLAEAQAELTELAQRQEGLRRRMDEAAAEPDAARRGAKLQELAQQQQALQAQTEPLSRRLERLLAQQAAQSTQAASEKMTEAAQAAQARQVQAAGQRAAAAKEALDQASRELAQRRQQAEADLAGRQLARLADTISSLHKRQQAAMEEAKRLDDLRQVQGQLTAAQGESLGQLARQQGVLQDETTRLSRQLGPAGPFPWTLDQAAEAMGRAAGLLGRRRADEPVHRAQQEALARLALALAALQPDPPEARPQQPSAGGGQGKGPPRPPGEGIPPVAQLKLLRLLQEDLNARTEAAQRQFGSAPSDEARRVHEELSRQQGRLAELVLQWLQAAPEQEPPETIEDEK